MKIVFCDNSLVSLINFRGEVIKYFIRSKAEVFLVYPKITETGDIDDFIKNNCQLFAVDMLPTGINPVRDLTYILDLHRIYKRIKPDIVFNYTIKPNIYSTIVAWSLGIKHRISMLAGLGYVFGKGGLIKRLARLLYKFSLSLCSRVIVLNQENYDVLLSRGYVKQDRLILFKGGEGVDFEKYKFVSNSFEELHFLMIARLLFDKGYREFVRAAEIVKKKFPKAEFELLGALDEASPMGVPKKQLEEDMQAGYIKYLGVTKDVYSVVSRQGVIVVLPSYHEGMNRSLMEACSIGRPIITSNISGCKELVDNGLNGFLVEPRNAEDLADKIFKFIELSPNEKKRMCLHSFDKAKTCFDIKLVIEDYQNILKSLNINQKNL